MSEIEFTETKMGSGVSTNPWNSTYEEIKNKHDSAYLALDKAITLEEQQKPEEAIENYKIGIELIDDALRIQVTCPENPDFTWEKACVMIQKMKKSRAEALMRINSIHSTNNLVPPEQPPSYEEAISTPSSPTTASSPCTYSDLAKALSRLRINQDLQMEAEIIYVYEGVRLYFILPNGEVSSTSEPQTLKIILVESEGDGAPTAILQIGGWIYPLIPGVSPCYRTDYGAFILPNVYSEQPGASIGIILPSDADAEVYDLLANILYGIVGEYKPTEIPAEADISQRISSGLVNGAWYLSQGLVKGAEKVGDLLNYSTPKLMSHMKSTEQPTELPPPVTKGMQIAETATNKAAQVTGYIADQVGIATMKLGHYLAPHIQKQGTRLLTSGFRMSEQDASAKMKGLLTVAAGAVEGFSTIYQGLETSASILGQNLKDNTVKVVKHKYGQPAGEFAGNTLSTVGNVIHINQNTKVVFPKSLAKRTVKQAGRAMYTGPSPSTSRQVVLRRTNLLSDEKKKVLGQSNEKD